jgi:AcrR family transcriptional regulator
MASNLGQTQIFRLTKGSVFFIVRCKPANRFVTSKLNLMKNVWELLEKKELPQKIMIGRAASKLFNDKGYLQTTTKDIADSAKLSKGGLFHYFASKDDVLYFILKNYMDFALENFEHELAELKDATSKIRFIISRHINFYLANSSEGKTLFRDAHLLPAKYFKAITEKERKYYKIVAGILFDFFKGNIEKSELTILAFELIGMCNWIFSWYDPKGSITPQKLSEFIYNIFFAGVSGYKKR